MAFRLMDFGIPNFDSNVDFLYKKAVEHGTSYICGDEEYLVYRLNDTPALIVLHFIFEADGETPKKCIAHTFLENTIHWEDPVVIGENGEATITHADWTVPAEVINANAEGHAYSPMLYADEVRFGQNRLEVRANLSVKEGALMPLEDGTVQLLARIEEVTPVIMSKLWMFSVIRLKLEDGQKDSCIELIVGRDEMENKIQYCDRGSYCYLKGPLVLLKDWK